MYLFQSWKESLMFFKPANFMLFMLVTLKSIIETVKVWLKYFWWIIAFSVALDIIAMLGFEGPMLSILDIFEQLLVNQILVFTLILAARSSVKRKAFTYFWSYKWYVVLLTVSEPFFLFPLVFLGLLIFRGPEYFDIIPKYFLLFGPLMWTYALFFFDSKGRIKDLFLSLWRSFKMIIFNYPFYFIMFLAIELIKDGFYFITDILGLTFLDFYINLLFLPIVICIFTNFYIKRMHDQSKFYFGD